MNFTLGRCSFPLNYYHVNYNLKLDVGGGKLLRVIIKILLVIIIVCGI